MSRITWKATSTGTQVGRLNAIRAYAIFFNISRRKGDPNDGNFLLSTLLPSNTGPATKVLARSDDVDYLKRAAEGHLQQWLRAIEPKES